MAFSARVNQRKSGSTAEAGTSAARCALASTHAVAEVLGSASSAWTFSPAQTTQQVCAGSWLAAGRTEPELEPRSRVQPQSECAVQPRSELPNQAQQPQLFHASESKEKTVASITISATSAVSAVEHGDGTAPANFPSPVGPSESCQHTAESNPMFDATSQQQRQQQQRQQQQKRGPGRSSLPAPQDQLESKQPDAPAVASCSSTARGCDWKSKDPEGTLSSDTCQQAVAAMVSGTTAGMKEGLELLRLPNEPLTFIPGSKLHVCGVDIRSSVNPMIHAWFTEDPDIFFRQLALIRRRLADAQRQSHQRHAGPNVAAAARACLHAVAEEQSGARGCAECSDDPYSLLGVAVSASLTEIRKRFHDMVLVHHPVRGGDTTHFERIDAAYAVLCSEEQRRNYDETWRRTDITRNTAS